MSYDPNREYVEQAEKDSNYYAALAAERVERSRLQSILVSVDMLWSMMAKFLNREEQHEVTITKELAERLPLDARVVDCQYDWSCRAYAFTIHSETFDPVPDGHLIPRLGNAVWVEHVYVKEPTEAS